MAAGSLISVGDPSGALKLEAAVAAPATGMRLAAVQAASRAQKPIVLPTLKLGAGDRVFDVQLTAAEGLSLLNLEKALALPILTSAMKAKDTATVSRALTALTRFGEAPKDDARTPAQMLESADPAQRLAAVPVVQEMPMAERLPLLRRLLADPDQQVRRAGVDAVESVVKKAPEEAIKLYKPLVTDADPVVRSKASGQMSRLVVEPPKTAATPAPEPVPAAAPAPAPDDALPKVLESLAQVKTAAAAATAEIEALDKIAAEVSKRIKDDDDDADKQVADAVRRLKAASERVEQTTAQVESAAKTTATTAGAAPSAEAAAGLKEAQGLAAAARKAADAARRAARDAEEKGTAFIDSSKGDVTTLLSAAALSIRTGELGKADKSLAEAAKLLKSSGARNPTFDQLQGKLYQARADETEDPVAKRKHLTRAQAAYQRLSGSGGRLQADAAKQLQSIASELSALDAK